ncbi:MAG: 4'-phosphopantetheinyl transferase superfamily protein [Desulfobacteraceae bacterium]
MLSRLARKALAVSCEKSGCSIVELNKDQKGAPLPENGYYWSLSHKSQFTAGVVAPYPVGIDIEIIRPCSESLKKRVASKTEWKLASNLNQDLTFFRFWTAKEAVLKAVGVGMTGLSLCRVTKIVDKYRLCLTYDGTPFMVTQIQFCSHIAAVVSDECPIYWTHLSKMI